MLHNLSRMAKGKTLKTLGEDHSAAMSIFKLALLVATKMETLV